jgi:prepilin-type N-terminal cleavage/methylation domain-containing protein
MECLPLKKIYKKNETTEKGFTLVELIVVLTIIMVLSSLGVFLYQRAIDQAKETVCKTNLAALHEAIDFYLSENDTFPSSLVRLKFEHVEKGYAKAMRERNWYKKLCFFLVKLNASDQAYAQFLTQENLQKYGVTEKIFHCPADPNGGASYGINANLIGKRATEIGGDVVILADCDTYSFSSVDGLTKRHRNKAFLLRKDGGIVEASDDRTPSLAELAVEDPLSTSTDEVNPSTKPEKDVVKPDPDPNWHAVDNNKNR